MAQGIRHNRFIKELTTLNLRGIDYHINVKEFDPLYCLVFEAIESNKKASNLMLNGEADDTESISDSLESMGAIDTGTSIDGNSKPVSLQRDVAGMNLEHAKTKELFDCLKKS